MKKPTAVSFAKQLENIGNQTHQHREAFAAFCKFAACALSLQLREDEYMAEVKRWPREIMPLFADALGQLVIEMEQRPFHDLLGDLHMEILGNRGQQWNGEFYTPHHVSDAIARMLIGTDLPKKGPINVCEPAAGAGRMILSCAAAMPKKAVSRLRVLAIDINSLACDMTYINTTLWCIPTVVIHGNALSGESWNRWPNFPMRMFEPRWRTIYPEIPLIPRTEEVPQHNPEYYDKLLAELTELENETKAA